MWGLGFWVEGGELRVKGSGFRVQGPGFGVQGSGFSFQGAGCSVHSSWFMVQGPGSRVQGSGFRGFTWKRWRGLLGREQYVSVESSAAHTNCEFICM